MFWTVMTVVATVVAVLYSVIGYFGVRWGMPTQRARKFAKSGWLAVGWAAVCYGHFALK